MFAKIRAWFTQGLATTEQMDQLKAAIAATDKLLSDFRVEGLDFRCDMQVFAKDSMSELKVISGKLDARGAFKEELQKFIHAQYETNSDIVNAMQAVDSRVEHYIALLQGCPADEDELPLEQKPDLADLAASLYEIRNIVEAFKADLVTQVRLSQSDYDDLQKASDERLTQFAQRIDRLQKDLDDFRVEFKKASGF